MSDRSYADEAGLAGFGAGILAGGVKAYTKKPDNKLQAFQHRFLGKKPSVKDVLLGAGLTGLLWSGAGIGLGSLVQKSHPYNVQLKEDNFPMYKEANVLGAIRGFGSRAMGAANRGMSAAGRGVGAAGDMAGAGIDAVRGATAGLPVIGAGGMAGQAQMKAQLAANAVRRGLKSKIRTFKGMPLSHQAGMASAAAIGSVGLGAAAYKQASEEEMIEEIEKFAAEAAYDPEFDMEGDNELAKLAAEELYQECLEKMAFAEELYAQAVAADEFVKHAAYDEFDNYDFGALDAFHEQKRMERAMDMLEKEAGAMDAIKGFVGKAKQVAGAPNLTNLEKLKLMDSNFNLSGKAGLGAAGIAGLAALGLAGKKGLGMAKNYQKKQLLKALAAGTAGGVGIGALGASIANRD